MGPFGISWIMFLIWFIGGPGMIIIALIFTKSKWWKEITDYYFSWNVDD